MSPLLERFFRNESGSATVEFVLWMPMIFAVFILAADVSMIFYSQTEVLRITQDANRNASIGRLAQTADVESYIESRLQGLSPTANAQSAIVAGVISTTVTYPAKDFEVIGLFSAFNSLSMTVHAEHLIENWGT